MSYHVTETNYFDFPAHQQILLEWIERYGEEGVVEHNPLVSLPKTKGDNPYFAYKNAVTEENIYKNPHFRNKIEDALVKFRGEKHIALKAMENHHVFDQAISDEVLNGAYTKKRKVEYHDQIKLDSGKEVTAKISEEEIRVSPRLGIMLEWIRQNSKISIKTIEIMLADLNACLSHSGEFDQRTLNKIIEFLHKWYLDRKTKLEIASM